jgi:hypothetical protein
MLSTTPSWSTARILLHTLDLDKHLVQVPLVPRPRLSVVQAVGKALAEFLAPAQYRLIGDDNTTFSQEQLDMTQAETEHMV